MLRTLFIITLSSTLVLLTWHKEADARPQFRSAKNISRAINRNINQKVRPRMTIKSRFASPITLVSANRAWTYLLSGDTKGRLFLWNLITGQRITQLTGPNIVTTVAISDDGQYVVAGAKDSTVWVWNLNGVTEHKVIPVISKLVSGHKAALVNIEIITQKRMFVSTDVTGMIRVCSLVSSACSQTFFAKTDNITAARLSKDAKHIVVSNDAAMLSVFALDTGRLLNQFSIEQSTKKLLTTANGNVITASYNDAILWHGSSGQLLQRFRGHKDVLLTMALSADERMLVTGSKDKTIRTWQISGQMVRKISGHAGFINDLTVSTDGKFIVSASQDKTMRVWRKNGGKELARLVSMNAGWAVINPAGFFDGTLDGEAEDSLSAVKWEVKQMALGVDGFLEGYYRPGLLSLLFAGKTLSQRRQPVIADGFQLPPKMAILTPKRDSVVNKDMIAVTVVAKDQGGGIDEIRLFHNGKIVDSSSVKPELTNDGDQTIQTSTYMIALATGDNTFKTIGLSRDRIESLPQQVRIRKTSAIMQKPTLHMISIGINKYKNKDLTLDFAVPDANSVLMYFREISSLFKQVKEHFIIDEHATRKSILKALFSLQPLPPDDIVVLFISGHGKTIKDNWYFVPYNLLHPEKDNKLIQNGLSSRTLKDVLTKAGARRILFLIDACHSGSVADAFDEFANKRSMALLSRSTGIHIGASSTTQQQSFEIEILGHGAFTYAVLEGLRGYADAGLKDRKVSTKELLKYVSYYLPKLTTKYKLPNQNPVTSSIGNDFVISYDKRH